ncbi:MAG: peptidoglycan bridge formation glycyltransferase FemA/FemB family protein [Aliifodinibius sp.]|nr:peptidoglycan bridge formation glycyltransferase FemA/FemB family protein [Fodinibius sp.]
MDLKIVNRLDIGLWKEFVDDHPDSNIYHTPEMFEVFSQTRGYKPSVWAVIDGSGQILALHLPIQITLRGGILHYLTSRNVNFGSVLAINHGEGKQALSHLFQNYNRQVSPASLFTELRHVTDVSDFQNIFEQHGYHYERHLNYFVDLDRDPYDILQSFSRTTRRIIRSHIREENVVVKEITEPNMLPLFYELIKMTYTYAKIPLADKSLFEAAFNILVPKKMARFTIAYVNGAPASASASLQYKNVIYGWYNGMDRSFGRDNPNELIIWELMKWGIDHGYKVFDFGGAGNPEEESGVRNFKLKFKGDLYEYGRNTCIHAPFRMNLAVKVYELGRRVLQWGGS